ncbi:general transcription factor II-I repeat domain-containing protein 2A-like [Watersipora subatra]|uniref:general transcription factor II-I repeat domain-containing protein 2A-like n=1 Tax=Watersipora subatra TaxID=2589382 RepID=UPI00355B61ED
MDVHVAHLAVFLRFLDSEEMKEELLTLVRLEGETTGQAIYDALVKRLDTMEIPFHKYISVTTDGTPAMVGREQGVIARLKKDMPSMLAFHCIIHQTVLCGKLNDHFQQLMCMAMKKVNFLRSPSALKPKTLRNFEKLNLNARQFQEMMSFSKDMSDLAFLVDICGHLNDLNLKLQGKNKTIDNTLSAV